MRTRTRVPLADLTTLGVGGPVEELVEAHTTGELISSIREAGRRGQPVLLVGGGSNLVVSDAGFAGVAIVVRTQGLSTREDGASLVVAAGQSWDDLVAYAVSRQLAGIECLAGIPGLVGATPIQNVGAYGQEVADVITRVQAYDRTSGELCELSPAECGFHYRDSRFKAESERWVITEVEFTLLRSALSEPVRYAELSRALGVELDGSSCAALPAVRDAVLALRRAKGMVLDPQDRDTASAGSFFTNPVLDREAFAALATRAGAEPPAFALSDGRVKVPAAWLITRAGYVKGFTIGRAGLSTKHPLAVTNRGGASAAEVIALARQVRNSVRDQLGITLVNEPVLVGESL